MTKSDNQILTELLGGCWHEVEPYLNENDTNNYICKKCDLTFYTFYHLGNPNPTWDNPADILLKMKEFLGEGRYLMFVNEEIGMVDSEDKSWIYIEEMYITTTNLLLEKAVEFLEKERGNEL